jgi:hypothetical protein
MSAFKPIRATTLTPKRSWLVPRLSSIFGAITGTRTDERRARETRDLIRREASIGGRLFGPIPEGGRREFFCLDEHTWVWHEEWIDESNVRHAITTRYDVRPHGIFKAQDGQPYRPLSDEEALHFFKATKLYVRTVKEEVFKKSDYLSAIS